MPSFRSLSSAGTVASIQAMQGTGITIESNTKTAVYCIGNWT